ncbi:MAG TPA: serine hydrolase domain-containing protein [Candidatus Acidoferrales bacterium]|nr:serine hydrolase domain-containing protein [Candidatus Acidoferrales bacterium]
MRRIGIWFAILLSALAGGAAWGQSRLPAEVERKIDEVARAALARTGVPSASLAVVNGGRISYLQAYGDGRLEPPVKANPAMRYSIGSISKQFTATAILMLQEQGKLSLDDPVAKYVSGLTDGDRVTIRELLSHTSGYQDFWPQDYVMPGMLEPTTARKILDGWARKPLDFAPGTKWQYSNTNFVIAGLVVEKAAGKPIFEFLEEKVFGPLGMKSVTNTDQGRLGESDAEGYFRYGLGPLRPAPKEGKGWLFAAGELAMTAEDLAKWDLSLIGQTLMKPESYLELETEVRLKNGLGTEYGLGVGVSREFGHRAIAHGGEVSGFTSRNVVFPDDRVAVVVLTNMDAAGAAARIAKGVAPLLLSADDSETPAKLEQAKEIFAGLQQGKLDRGLFTGNANFYFSGQGLKDFAASLGPLGAPEEFVQTEERLRGGMKERVYRVKAGNRTLRVWTYEMPDGKLEQYQVAAAD